MDGNHIYPLPHTLYTSYILLPVTQIFWEDGDKRIAILPLLLSGMEYPNYTPNLLYFYISRNFFRTIYHLWHAKIINRITVLLTHHKFWSYVIDHSTMYGRLTGVPVGNRTTFPLLSSSGVTPIDYIDNLYELSFINENLKL